MASFDDDFNRPDGLLGNGWTTPSNRATIVGQEVHFSALGYGSRSAADAASFVRVRATVKTLSGGSSYGGVVCKLDQAANQCYEAHYYFTTVSSGVSIIRWNNLSQTQLVSQTWSPRDTGPHTVELTWDAGNLVARVDGTIRCGVEDHTYDDHVGYGLRGSGTSSVVDDFHYDDVASPETFDVKPDAYEEYGPDPAITFTGTGTAWTPGTPGDPVFTVDEGAIINQTIDSATHGTADYQTPITTKTVTFTDPSTGLTDTLDLTTNFAVAGGDNSDVLAVLGTPAIGETVIGDLNKVLDRTFPATPQPPAPDYITLLEQSDYTLTIGQLFTLHHDAIQNEVVPDMRLWTALEAAIVLAARNLGLGIDTNTEVHTISTLAHYSLLDVMNSVKGVTNVDNTEIWNYLHDLRTVNGYDLGTLLLAIEAIGGTDDRDLTEVYNLVQSLGMPNLQQIMDELNWITGTRDTSLPALKALLQTLQTTADGIHTDLESDYNALTSTGAHNLAEVLARIADLWGGEAHDLADIYHAIGGLQTWLTPELTWIKNLLATINAKVDTLGVNVDYIKTHLPTVPRSTPVWPGLSGVQLGTPVPYSTGVTINGPLSGILLDVSVVGIRKPPFQFDGDKSHQGLGAVTFQTDTGHDEFPQLLGFEHGIYTPQTMYRASKAKVRGHADVTGTITPWLLPS